MMKKPKKGQLEEFKGKVMQVFGNIQDNEEMEEEGYRQREVKKVLTSLVESNESTKKTNNQF